MWTRLHPGQVEVVRRVFEQDDFDRFAALSGDDNPIHVDPAFATRTKFGRTVAHGMLLYSAVCGVLGRWVQVGQELMFPSPTYRGEEVAIRVAVGAVSDADGVAEVATTITRPMGSVGLDGRAWLRPPGSAWPGLWLAASVVPPAEDAPFKGMSIGQWAELSRAFSAADVAEYVALAGYARADGPAPGDALPGPLLGALFSTLLGTRLPGRGTNYLKQRLHFPAPAHVDEVLSARVEIVRIRTDKQLVNLATTCTNQAGEVVCQGEALVLVSDMSDVIRTGDSVGLA